jgi:hypothetical protein
MRHPPAVAALAAVFIAGCGTSTPAKACTLIGASSMVSADVSALARAHPSAVSGQLCVDSLCREQVLAPEGNQLNIQTVGVRTQRAITVTVGLADRAGKTLVSVSANGVQRGFLPNGPGCGDPVFQATFTTTRDRLLQR